MKGLDICREYFEKIALPVFEKKFPDLMKSLAFGLAGQGSECFGFDDETSKDHDYDLGFVIFVPDNLDEKVRFSLEKEYLKLPDEYLQMKRDNSSPVGGSRRGVKTLSEFFSPDIAICRGLLDNDSFMNIPEYFLSELTNGEIFYDGFGAVSEIRQNLSHYPNDVKMKKMAGELLLCAQAGQYNYPRCIKRGDTAAGQMCIIEFVKSAMHFVFLLNDRFCPYYKWSFRAFSSLEKLSGLKDSLEYLISSDNSDDTSRLKMNVIEDISVMLHGSISETAYDNLEKSAYELNGRVRDTKIRNSHILSAV